MAMRQLRYTGGETLTEQCKPVEETIPRITELIEDMFETMYENFDAGLAASQVGVLEQIVTIDMDDGHQYVLINPETIEEESEQTGLEGCPSVPGKSSIVTRPQKVKVRAYDENVKQFELEGEDLLTRCICHECAHLKGELCVTRVEGELTDMTTGDGEEEEE